MNEQLENPQGPAEVPNASAVPTHEELRQRSKRTRKGVAEEGVPEDAWRRVSPVTPVLNSWRVLVALLAIFLYQGFDSLSSLASLSSLRELADSVGIGRVALMVFGGLLVVLLVVGLYSYFSWRGMTYAVTDQAVWMRQGIVFRQQRHVRLERIQAIDVTHPLLGRIFGMGRLSVQAAGATDSSLAIGFLKDDDLVRLRAQILALAAGLEVPGISSLAATSVSSQAASAGEVHDDSENESPALVLTDRDSASSFSLEAPEELVYSVTSGRLIGSLLLSLSVLFWLLVIVASVVAGIALLATKGPDAALAVLPSFLAPALVIVSLLWSRFSGEFNFEAAVSPDGIRIRRGLLERRAETIPPRRVHGVKISQPILWRRQGWYRVVINQASSVVEDNGTAVANQALLPVGTRAETEKALSLVFANLGVDDPEQFVTAALDGVGPSPYFCGVSPKARIFDPLNWRRKAIALTETTVVVRNGWLTRTASFVPYERIQSVAGFTGPLASPRNLEGVRACLVPGPVEVSISNLDIQDGERIRSEIVERSRLLRVEEPPERWFARVSETETESTGVAQGGTAEVQAEALPPEGSAIHAPLPGRSEPGGGSALLETVELEAPETGAGRFSPPESDSQNA